MNPVDLVGAVKICCYVFWNQTLVLSATEDVEHDVEKQAAATENHWWSKHNRDLPFLGMTKRSAGQPFRELAIRWATAVAAEGESPVPSWQASDIVATNCN